MADAVTTQIIENGSRNLVMSFTNNSDGTGEAAVVKVNAATLGLSITSMKIRRIKYSITGGAVIVAFDATTDSTVVVLTGYGVLDLVDTQGLLNPATTGNTGNVLFTTKNFAATSAYDIVLEMVKGNTP